MTARLVRLIAAQAVLYRDARSACVTCPERACALRELLHEQSVQIQQAVELLLTHCLALQGRAASAGGADDATLVRRHRALALRARRLLDVMDSGAQTAEIELLLDLADSHERAAHRLYGQGWGSASATTRSAPAR